MSQTTSKRRRPLLAASCCFVLSLVGAAATGATSAAAHHTFSDTRRVSRSSCAAAPSLPAALAVVRGGGASRDYVDTTSNNSRKKKKSKSPSHKIEVLSTPFLDAFQQEVQDAVAEYRNEVRYTFGKLRMEMARRIVANKARARAAAAATEQNWHLPKGGATVMMPKDAVSPESKDDEAEVKELLEQVIKKDDDKPDDETTEEDSSVIEPKDDNDENVAPLRYPRDGKLLQKFSSKLGPRAGAALAMALVYWLTRILVKLYRTVSGK